MKTKVVFCTIGLVLSAFAGIALAGTEGNINTFYGQGAGGSTTGDNDYDTFIGAYAGYHNTTGDYNTFMGYLAGYNNTTGASNTFLGNAAGYSNTTGFYNTFMGYDAGYSNTTGAANIFLGYDAGYSNTTGGDNIFLGNLAGYSNTTGYANTFLGNLAGYSNTTGYNNTFLGLHAGYSNTTGDTNTFLGRYAGSGNTTGYSNTFLGVEAGLSNTTGGGNTFLGYEAAYNNSTGGLNTLVGYQAGVSNTTGYQNTFLGYRAGYSNTTGFRNVFLGYYAGYNETGSNKLYIDNSDTATPLIYGEFDNHILTINGNLEVIGPYQGLVYLSNTTADSTNKVSRMVLNHYTNAELPVYLFGAASTSTDNFVAFGGGNTIGNAATQIDLFTAENTTTPVGTPRLTIIGNGYVGLGTQTPAYPLEMLSGAYVTTGGVWTNASSREYKDNIKGLKVEDAIETLRGLNPVTFSYKVSPEENHVGFVAEEVPDLVATKDRKGLSPMDVVAVLTKVVQEQQKTIEEQKKEYQKTISTMREELNELKGKVR